MDHPLGRRSDANARIRGAVWGIGLFNALLVSTVVPWLTLPDGRGLTLWDLADGRTPLDPVPDVVSSQFPGTPRALAVSLLITSLLTLVAVAELNRFTALIAVGATGYTILMEVAMVNAIKACPDCAARPGLWLAISVTVLLVAVLPVAAWVRHRSVRRA